MQNVLARKACEPGGRCIRLQRWSRPYGGAVGGGGEVGGDNSGASSVERMKLTGSMMGRAITEKVRKRLRCIRRKLKNSWSSR